MAPFFRGGNRVLGEGAWYAPWGIRRRPRQYPTNPFFWIEHFPMEHKAKFIPSEEDAKKVLNGAQGAGKIYLVVLAETGARPGEARELKWDNPGDSHLVLFTRKKRGGHLTPRRVPVPRELVESLRELRACNPDAIYVFKIPPNTAHFGEQGIYC